MSLEEVSGDNLAPVTIEEGKSSGESGGGDTPENSLGNVSPPAGLSLVNSLVEEVVEEQRLEARVLLVRRCDVTEEDRLDDTTTTPHARNTSVVQVPAELFAMDCKLVSGVLAGVTWRERGLMGIGMIAPRNVPPWQSHA